MVGFLVLGWILVCNFKQYTHNIRYLIAPMTVIMVFAPLGIHEAAQLITKKWRLNIQVVLIGAMLVLMRDKISWLPQTYYSPNKDFYGDIQTADYKTFMGESTRRYPDLLKSTLIAPISFMGHNYVDYGVDLYLIRSEKKVAEMIAGVPGISQVSQMTQFMKNHHRGYLIVEKWHTFVPDDMQEYAAAHMEKLVEVKSLPQSPDDPWPLILYRWDITRSDTLPL